MTQNHPNGSICAEEYVVKRGDSFYLIAHKLGVPLRDLLAANRNIHPARLMVGDVLCIPREEDDSPDCGGLGGSTGGNGSGGTVAPDASLPGENTRPVPACPIDQQYSVENGQTVEDIQLRNLLSRHTLQQANPGVNLDQLQTGQVLCVPTENVSCDVPNSYTLTQGETLDTLAVKFNLPVGSLLRANPCLAPQDFEEGTSVVLP
ncbi:MAG: LysM peptidoglycan-binding domain-containing protein [Clostridia bacterium]|nr:LysM peptidoglycan-binding domain-containing protein [Clostridia bacterium]